MRACSISSQFPHMSLTKSHPPPIHTCARLIAEAKLPISNATLRYGSADGAVHVKTDEHIAVIMQQIASILYLAPHGVTPVPFRTVNVHPTTYTASTATPTLHDEVAPSGAAATPSPHAVTLCGPADIEVHRSVEDGRLYVLDLARLFPPEPPWGAAPPQPPNLGSSSTSDSAATTSSVLGSVEARLTPLLREAAEGPADPAAHLHRLLRPELVKRWGSMHGTALSR